jgi:hypothetical protein
MPSQWEELMIWDNNFFSRERQVFGFVGTGLRTVSSGNCMQDCQWWEGFT